MAKECHYQPATHMLFERHRRWINVLIARRARQGRLGAADIDDAQQEGWFWLIEGIGRYDTLELARPNGCRFRTFLYTVIGSRVIDFARSIWRRRSHYEQARRIPDPADIRPGAIKRVWPEADDCNEDPLAALLWQEALERLQSAVDCLDPGARDFWQSLASGSALHDIACQLGLSFQQARGQRQRLLAKLKIRLCDERTAPVRKIRKKHL
jgi:RNA polymerase sigma factor (sigma-70 family)